MSIDATSHQGRTHHAQATRRHCLSVLAAAVMGWGLGPSSAEAAGWSHAQASTRPSSIQPVVLALSQRHSLCHLPLLLAQMLGFFDQEGVALTVQEFDSDESALKAVSRGGASLAACDYAVLLSQQAKGLDWRSLVVQTRTPQVVLGAWPRLHPDIRGVQDLRGRRVGVLPSGPGVTVLDAALRRHSMVLGDVMLMPMRQASDVIHAYRTGQVDAFSLNDKAVAGLEQAGMVRVLADTRSLRDTRELFGNLLPGAVICAPGIWGAKQDWLAQKVVNAVVHALKWIQTAGPSDLIKAVPEADLLPDHAVFLAAFEKAREGFSVDGWMSDQAASTALRIRSQQEPALRVARVDVARTFTNEFAQRAKQRFRV